MIIADTEDNIPKLLKVDANRELFVTLASNTYKYVQFTDDTSGTTQTLWDPAAGKEVHFSYVDIYADKACTVEIYNNSSGTTSLMLDLAAKGEKKGNFGIDVVLATNNVLGAKLTSNSGTTTCRITVIGHEH